MSATRRGIQQIAFGFAIFGFGLLLVDGAGCQPNSGTNEGPGAGGVGGVPASGEGGSSAGGASATGSGGTGGSAAGGRGGGGAGGAAGATSGAGGQGGINSSGCAGTLVKCGTTCTDLNGSQSNCGACGKACRADMQCFQGACRCATGQLDCSGVCKDAQSTNTNCGACGNVCATGATCIAGVCTCPGDGIACSGACVSPTTDRTNCGRCANVCSSATQCLFGACLDPASLSCTPAAQANTSSTRDAFITLGKYWVNNNQWGASTGSGTQTIWSTCQQGDLIGWGTSWNWTGTANAVKSFASNVFGWQWGWRLTNTGLPVQISSGKQLNCGWDFTVTQTGGALDVAYDIWVHTQAMAGTNDNPSDEIMIWLYRANGAGPIGPTVVAGLTLEGTTWDLHEGMTTQNGRPLWAVHSFVRTANATTAVINVMDFMNYLVTRGMASSKYVSSIQSGTEVFSGTGQLNTRGFYCRIQ